jgi:hypothetical protein
VCNDYMPRGVQPNQPVVPQMRVTPYGAVPVVPQGQPGAGRPVYRLPNPYEMLGHPELAVPGDGDE